MIRGTTTSRAHARSFASRWALAAALVGAVALPGTAYGASVSASNSVVSSASVSVANSASAATSVVASSDQSSANASSNAVSISQSNSANRSTYAANCGAGPRIEPTLDVLGSNGSNELRVYCFRPNSELTVHLGIKLLDLRTDSAGRAVAYFFTPCHLGLTGANSILVVGHSSYGVETATLSVTVNCGPAFPVTTASILPPPIAIAPVIAPQPTPVALPAPPVALSPSFTG